MVKSRTIAGRFRIENLDKDLLGQGGMGHVYRGVDSETGQPVAIKILRPEIIQHDPTLLERFARESESLRQLDHPHIVKMVATVSEADHHCLVMEYVPGGSLQELIKRQGKLAVTQVIEIGLDLADALSRAHRLHIIHRDIKPANVLLAADGTPRLSDFGTARQGRHTDLTHTGVILGTVGYLSPEACEGAVLDERTDIWGFGVLLYEMLSGRLPFARDSLAATFKAILTEPTPNLTALRPDLPEALTDLVYRMLEKERSQRIPSIRLVGAELEAMLLAAQDPGRTRPYHNRFILPADSSTLAQFRSNLPASVTPFVGRQQELAELVRWLEQPDIRLVTIWGTGGIGKTRLALEAGAAQIHRFEQGVFFVSLAALPSADHLVNAIAESLRFTFYEGGQPQQQLLDYLRHRHLLLILDNFEHLLAGTALVAEILQAAPAVKLIATSRERLQLQGEHLLPLEGMELAAGQDLFLRQVRRLQPAYQPSPAGSEAIGRLCRLVEGVPLAIMLAASWITMLTPAEIAAELEQNLDLLAGNFQDLPARQQSIGAVFDYSWKLLSPQEQAILPRLTVFQGGFSRAAAQAVAGASLPQLMGLVNKSLLRRTPGGRYEIHELLCQYAAERLDTAGWEAVQQQHAAYYLSFIQEQGRLLQQARQMVALETMQAESENMRAAWQWAVRHSRFALVEAALEGLSLFFGWLGRYQEGNAACQLLITRLGKPSSSQEQRLLAHALIRQSSFAERINQPESAYTAIQQAQSWVEKLAAAGEDTRREQANLDQRFAFMAYIAGQRDTARQFYEQSLSGYQALGELSLAANILSMLGEVDWSQAAYGKAEKRLTEAVALYRQLGDQRGCARVLTMLGLCTLYQGEFAAALSHIREGSSLYRQLGDRPGQAFALLGAGLALFLAGRFAEAEATWQRALAIHTDLGFRAGIGQLSSSLGYALLHLGQYQAASQLAERGLAIARDFHHQREIALALNLLGAIAIGEERYQDARQHLAGALAIDEAIGQQDEVAQVMAYLGLAAVIEGETQSAYEWLFKALWTAGQVRAFVPIMIVLPAVALHLCHQGQLELAVELNALATGYPVVAESRWFQEVISRRLEEQWQPLSPEQRQAAHQRGRSRSLEQTVADLITRTIHW